MLLRYSLGLEDEALAVEAAVTQVLQNGLRTGDIAARGQAVVGTRDMGAAIVKAVG
jgi:3-isopropylmalate dehydrogenase